MDRLGDIFECNPQVKLIKGKEYPLIDIDSIVVGKKYPVPKEAVQYTGQSGSKFCTGDTIMARITPCLENGKIAMVKVDSEACIGSTELFVFRGKKNKSINEYVYYFMKQEWVKNYAANSMTGASGRQRANLNFIKKIQFDFPNCATQEKIVRYLINYDELIEKNNKRISLLEQMAEQIYKYSFAYHKIKNNSEEKRLVDIIDFQRGISYSSEEIDCDDGNNLINLKNINSYGGFRRDGTKKYNGKYKNSQIVDTGDLIMGVTDMTQDRRTVGSVALIPTIDGISVISADLVKINSKIDNIFLYAMFKYGNLSKYISQFANGANVLHLKPQSINNVKVQLPKEELINKYVKIVKPIIEQIDKLNLQNNNLIMQRDLLLPRLMSRKLEVK